MIAQAIQEQEAEPSTEVLRIAAFLSVPLCGWNPHWGCTLQALRPFTNVEIEIGYGAWWDHSMSNLFEWAIEKDFDWILTMDYDSMFTAEDFSRLQHRLAMNPHIDAVAALQCRRGNAETPLMANCNGGDIEVNDEAVKVDSAHFGLTLFRVESLVRMMNRLREQLPSPEDIQRIADLTGFHTDHVKGLMLAPFLHVPDVNGSYRTLGRIDPDMYFWKKWRENGNTLYVDPHIRIGHLQAMVTEFDSDFKSRHVHVFDYRARTNGVIKDP